MATRNFVPRADNEGGIGTALKRWAAGCIVEITSNRVVLSDGAGNYMQLPKLTTAERDVLSAVNGMVIYNTTTLSLEAYENGAWGSMGVGENNTASNVGTAGVGVFKQKTGVDLEFKKINAGSSKITVTDDVGDDEVDIDVVVAEILTGGSITTAMIVALAVTTAKINAAAVTYAKIQDISATDKLLGRSTAGAGVTEEIACTAAGRNLLDDADVSAQIATLGLGNAKTINTMLWAESAKLPEANFALTGTVTMTNGSTAVTGSTTAFTTELQVNDYIKLDADNSASWAKVASIESATALTLTANYSGTGGASAGSGSGNPADLGEVIGSGRYMGWSALQFDDTLTNPDGGERAGWRIPMPDYDGGDIVLTGVMKPATTPVGAVTCILNIRTIGLATSEGFDKAVTADTGVNMSFSLNTTELSTDAVFATATIDPANVVAEDLMVIEIDRDVADTLSGDGQLLCILMKHTRT